MRRVQCRICYGFMNFKDRDGRTCSDDCERIAKERDAQTVEMYRRLEISQEERRRLSEEKKKEKREKQRIGKERRRRKRAEKAKALQERVSQQAKKIRLLKQGKERGDGFYESRRWQELRYRVLRFWGRVCMCCGASGCELHVDHIKPRSKHPELEMSFDNLQVLCRACNLGKGNTDEIDYRPKARSEEAVCGS